jgi:hypothetical protein
MSLRDHVSNIMDSLIASGLILLAVNFWPRIVFLFTLVKQWCWRWVGTAVSYILLRAPPPRRNTTITPDPSKLMINAPPEPFPVGTPSAIATAMQMTPQRPLSPFGFGPNQFASPTFVNNSQWTQWHAANQQHELAARLAMQSKMPRFNPSTLSIL